MNRYKIILNFKIKFNLVGKQLKVTKIVDLFFCSC